MNDHEYGAGDRGWVIVDRRWFGGGQSDFVVEQTEGVLISVGNRGEGHDEPSTYHTARLTKPEALRLAAAIIEVVV